MLHILMIICFYGLLTADALAEEETNLLTNGDFSQADDAGEPVGWTRRTKDAGYVKTHADTDPTYVEIGVKQPGEDSFLQQILKKSEVPDDTVKLRIDVKYRYSDVVKGDRGYQKGFIQGRFTKGSRDFGKWIDIAKMTGSSDGWQTAARETKWNDEADGLMIRLGAYGIKSGTVEVDYVKITSITRGDIAAERAKYRPEEEFGPEVSDERYGRIQQGININNWFCQPWNVKANGEKGGFNKEFFRAYITEHDINMIKEAGFDHVRLAIDPVFLMDRETGELKAELLPELDRAIQMIRDRDLAVIVDVHPKSNTFKKMSGKPKIRDNFIPWWGAFAKHLAETTDPEWVFLEILNEPGGQGYWNQSYPPYQDKLITEIRKNAPDHTIIASGGAYMLIWELEKFTPHTDRNVIWAVHYYEPSPFTHQGAVWMKDWYRPLRDVPWPLTEENIEEAVASVNENDDAADHAKQVLRNQLKSGWASRARLDEQMGKVAAWGKKHNRRMVIGEFGVYAKYAPRDSRVRYLEAVTTAMRDKGLGWSLWEYCGAGFPIVENPDAPSAKRKLDKDVVDALGLKSR